MPNQLNQTQPIEPIEPGDYNLILRNAAKGDKEINTSATTTISQLKAQYPGNVRLFYMGKELKTGNISTNNIKTEMTILVLLN